MRAVVYDAFDGPLEVRELPDPAAPDGGVVLEVSATGLCRSDWHGWRGHDSDIASFPHVPGHEYAGHVVEVGAGVDPAWLDRAVTAPFVLACGDCAVCARGDGQVCPRQTQPGFTHLGSYATYVAVRAAETNLVALPTDLSPVLAAGLGCRVATSFRAVTARAQVTDRDTVAVFGCGGVGLSAVMVAKALGAEVVAVDVAASSLDRARELGADHTVLAGHDVVDRVRELTDGGASVALDCIGSPDTCRDSVLALARRGRQVQVGLLPPAAGLPQVPMDRVIGWELDVLGSHGLAAGGYPALLAMVADGRVDVRRLLDPGEPLSLAQATAALPAMGDTPSEGLVLIDPSR